MLLMIIPTNRKEPRHCQTCERSNLVFSGQVLFVDVLAIRENVQLQHSKMFTKRNGESKIQIGERHFGTGHGASNSGRRDLSVRCIAIADEAMFASLGRRGPLRGKLTYLCSMGVGGFCRTLPWTHLRPSDSL